MVALPPHDSVELRLSGEGHSSVDMRVVKWRELLRSVTMSKTVDGIGILTRLVMSSLKPSGPGESLDGLAEHWKSVTVLSLCECGLSVHVQSDPAGRLVVSGQPEQPDNPWGVTPFKKVITLPSRIDPHQTSAVVTLHGQLFIRAPFEQPDL